MEIVYRRFGKGVRTIRQSIGMSQEQLAERVGLQRTSIVNIEAGRQRVLLNDLWKFSRALRCKPQELAVWLWK